MRTQKLDALLRRAASSPGVISFAGGLPADDTLPRESMAKAASEATLQMGTSPMQYDWPEGREGLRRLVAMRLSARGAFVDPEDVHITNGAQDALALAVGIQPAKTIQVDHATYPGALDVFEAAGCEAVAHRKMLTRYVMPAVSNPYGWSMSAEQRNDALDATWLLEDDAYADLCFDGPAPRPLLADAPDKVFHLGTLSKTLSPGLRIGWLVAPREWRARVRELKSSRDLQTCGLSQAIAERLLSSDEYDHRLQKLRAHYRERCQLLLQHLPELPHVRFGMPHGGFSIWVETDLHEDDGEFLERALRHGVAFDPGCFFRAPDVAPRGLCLRLSFSAVPLAQMAAGITRLAGAMRDARSAMRVRQAA